MRSLIALGDGFNDVPNKVVGYELDCPLVTVRYKDGNKIIEKQMRDVTDYFNNSEEIKAINIKVER